MFSKLNEQEISHLIDKWADTADKEVTKKLKEAAGFLSITLLDHLILTPEETCFSFGDEGLL